MSSMSIKPQFKTQLKNEAATHALGQCLAHQLVPGLVIYLHGELGAGKTTLTRALLHAAGFSGHVKSPTYALVELYNLTSLSLAHFDLYRLSSPEEFLDAGLREIFNNATICIIEWPEHGAAVLPPADLNITLSISGEGRQAELSALSDRGSACLNQLNFAPNL